MTQVTPPGWYPDPGRHSDGPPTERWWDGSAWTDQVRPTGTGAPAGPPADGAYPAYPVHPGYPGQVQPGTRRGLRTGIAAGVAVVVLACIGVGVYALTAEDGPGGTAAGSRQAPDRPDLPGGPEGPGGSDGGPGGPSRGPEGSEPPKVESGSVTDPLNGISLPVPDGWYGQQIRAGAQVASKDTYPCPALKSETCMKGGAYSAPALVLRTAGDTPEAVAKADIAANAKESYGKGYGKITSHKVLASEAVTVAGRKGYLVRWQAVTSEGSDGYVESLAFPSPASGGKEIAVVRLGVDVDQGQGVLDEIAKGIEVARGGGPGQDV
ncbi:DUF2510 domain-containing protein [Streptomyces sp. KAU_LT]|uniref:DUF2510 domain-containing protein n=1 Tax=Streptomyces sp. KAU_LT TaxID=3046669 RepID=UPI0024B85FB2|nr:DUF2510 domain-containing protein [Streptomyces sp. KAU_LT]MDI9830078.1 DUF2510 domain-containing protein [Streptomyces sp. KAU_LT]